MKKLRILLAAMQTLFPVLMSGQTASGGEADTPVYKRGNTFLELAFPPSPEAASVVKYADIPFLHSTGAAMLEIPFHTLKGKELEIPVGLSYVSGGIKLDEIAGVAGLGWTFEAGGCITRTVMDMPDEFRSAIMSHRLPSESLLAKLNDGSNRDTDKINYLTRILSHRVDSRLDRYSYNVCGLSGSFVIRDDGSVFQLSGSGVRITYSRNGGGEITSFTVIGPDGTVYRLSEMERGFHDGTDGHEPTVIGGEQDRWEAVTAWYISSVTSRSGLEQAVFTYESGGEWKRSQTTKSTTVTISNTGDGHLSYSSAASTIVRSYDTRKLTSVTLDGETVRFRYRENTAPGLHQGDIVQNYPVALSSATVYDINGRAIKSLDFGTARDAYDGRIKLNSLIFWGTDGQAYDRWTFTYDTRSGQVSRNSQDWYGYYNGRSSGYADYAPFHYSTSPYPATAPGTPDAKEASYMSLVRCDHNGAFTEISYEGNTILDTSIGVRVRSIISGGMSLTSPDSRVRTFRYEDPKTDGPRAPVQGMYTTVSAPLTAADMNGGSVTWSFTRHETPAVKGPSVRDTKVYYGKVTEMLGSTHISSFNPEMSKTIRYYDTSRSGRMVWSVADRFPESARSRYGQYPPYVQGYDPYEGIHTEYADEGPVCAPVLTRLEEYAGNGGGSRLVAATDYAYDEPSGTSVLVDYVAEMAWHPLGIGNFSYDYIFHYPVYATNLLSRQKVSETRIRYHADGSRDSMVVTTAYLPRSATLETPSRASAVSTTEALVTRKMSFSYADGTDGPYAEALRNQGYLSSPISRTYTVSRPISDLLISGAKPMEEDAKPIRENAWTDKLPWHPKDTLHSGQLATFTTLTVKEKTEFGYCSALPNTLLPCSHVEYIDGKESWREDILSRDSHGNIREVKEKGRPGTVILWGYGGKYPVASVENATAAEAYHGNPKAYFHRGYEISGRDKVLSTALPGYEAEHENTLEDGAATAFPKYTWETSGVSGGDTTYRDWEISKTVSTDADGRFTAVFKDHAGRTLGTSYGDDSPTYYIYDSKDRLSKGVKTKCVKGKCVSG